MINGIDEKYTQYADAVINGEIVACIYIKQACKRYIDFFTKYEFDCSAVDKVVNFCSHLKHYTGKSNGKPFILSPFQFWIVCAVFGFKKDGKRVCKNVYLELARKNGKSFFAAALALYCLLCDGEQAAEVEVVANSAKQASILFQMCSYLCDGIDRKNKYFKRYRDKIKFDKTKSFLQVLACDASTNDGWNSSCYIVDEYHSAKDSSMYDVLKSSQGVREQPLSIVITTAGFNMFGACYQLRTTYTEILAGIKTDDSMFAAIYTLDDGDDWKDNANFIKANPNLNITVREEYLKEQVTQAINQQSMEVAIRTKNFNQWLSSADVWLQNQLLIDCSKNLSIDDFKGKICTIGVDLAAVSDLTAVSILAQNDSGQYMFKTNYYLPATAFTESPNANLYKEWKRNGFVTNTGGNVTDYDYVLNDILKWRDSGCLIEAVHYDSWNATTWAINATQQSLNLQPFSQSLGNYNRPTKEFERALKMGNVIIDNNPVTRWCFSNVMLKYDWNDNCKPVKASTDECKIDGVIAMLTAFGGRISQPMWNNLI